MSRPRLRRLLPRPVVVPCSPYPSALTAHNPPVNPNNPGFVDAVGNVLPFPPSHFVQPLPQTVLVPYTPHGMVSAYDPHALPAHNSPVDPNTPVFVDAAGNILPFPVTGEFYPPVREDYYRMTLDTAPTDYERASYQQDNYQQPDYEQAGPSASNSNDQNQVQSFNTAQYGSVLSTRQEPPLEDRHPLDHADFEYLSTSVEKETETGTLCCNNVKESEDLSEADPAPFKNKDQHVPAVNPFEALPKGTSEDPSTHVNECAFLDEQIPGAEEDKANSSAVTNQTTTIDVNLPAKRPSEDREGSEEDLKKPVVKKPAKMFAAIYEKVCGNSFKPAVISEALHERTSEAVKISSQISAAMCVKAWADFKLPPPVSAASHERTMEDFNATSDISTLAHKTPGYI